LILIYIDIQTDNSHLIQDLDEEETPNNLQDDNIGGVGIQTEDYEQSSDTYSNEQHDHHVQQIEHIDTSQDSNELPNEISHERSGRRHRSDRNPNISRQSEDVATAEIDLENEYLEGVNGDEMVQEEHKIIPPPVSTNVQNDLPKVEYTSIRDRMINEPPKVRRTRSQRRNMALNSSENIDENEYQNQTPQETLPLEELIPDGDNRTAQGIIQLLSSKLLSQILSAGDFFQNEIKERFEEEIEVMKHQYFALWYEKLLKARIFLGKLNLKHL
jgi:hypothetical protein